MSQLRALASDRRKACDSACRIEFARAVAAQKWIAPWLVSVGRRCQVTEGLYDLPTGTSERTAAADASCSVEALSEALREIARKLSGE